MIALGAVTKDSANGLRVLVNGRCFVPSKSVHGNGITFTVTTPSDPSTNRAAQAGEAIAGSDGKFSYNVTFGTTPADCSKTFNIHAEESYNNAGYETPWDSNSETFTATC